MTAPNQATDEAYDPDEAVEMEHLGEDGKRDIADSAVMTRRQFDEVYAEKGWTIVKEDAAAAAPAVDSKTAQSKSAATGGQPDAK
jgi:hypothetical protein